VLLENFGWLRGASFVGARGESARKIAHARAKANGFFFPAVAEMPFFSGFADEAHGGKRRARAPRVRTARLTARRDAAISGAKRALSACSVSADA
jgi:hypothetical protein